jgi:hypothetical protein
MLVSRDWGKKSLVEIDNLEEIILEDGWSGRYNYSLDYNQQT